MTTAFAQLFWGFLFTLADFRVNGFDILPDVVGFLLISLACNSLRRMNTRFSTAYPIAVILLVVSVIDLLRIGGVRLDALGMGDAPGSVIVGSALVGLALFVLDLVMVYQICSGIREMAATRSLHELASEAQSRWVMYVVTATAGFVVFGVSALAAFLSGSLGGMVAIFGLFFVAYIVVIVLFLIMLRHAQTRIPVTGEALP